MNLLECEKWVADKLEQHNNFETRFSKEGIRKLVEYIDLTTLNPTDYDSAVKSFVERGLHTINKYQLPKVAAFCVFSNYATQTSNLLRGSGIETAVVASGFPYGQCDIESKCMEIAAAAKNGATEIDIVINRGFMHDNNLEALRKELIAMRNAAPNVHMKVILEVCELDLAQVYKASVMSIETGADFIKTSTGKGESGASVEASLIMCKAIIEHFNVTGKMIGLKVAGGISTSNEAAKYTHMIGTVLGNNWLTPKYYRIGASSLLKNIIADIQ